MKILKSIIILIISGTILNVWLLRLSKPTPFRGGDANTLLDEFTVYGLGETVFYVVGFVKVITAVFLLIGLFYKKTIVPAAAIIAFIMLVAVFMHYRVQDSFTKHLPALLMLILSIALIVIERRFNTSLE